LPESGQRAGLCDADSGLRAEVCQCDNARSDAGCMTLRDWLRRGRDTDMTTPTQTKDAPKDTTKDAGTDVPAIEQALAKAFAEVAPAVDDATRAKLAHTAVNTMKGLNRLTPEPAAEAPKK